MKLLSADIGATNARFALFVDGHHMASCVLASAELQHQADESGVVVVLKALNILQQEADISGIQGACLAVAGPVSNGIAKLTHRKLQFIDKELLGYFGYPFTVVNDLYATALGLDLLDSSTLVQIGTDQEQEVGGNRGVVAVGTGLGMSIVTGSNSQSEVVLPTEGGHMPVAATNALEKELVTAAEARVDTVTYEYFLSGPGLVNLYIAMCAVWGSKAEELSPEDVSERGLQFEPVCHKTLETFAGFLGTAASILGLMALPVGGIFIGGTVGLVLRTILEEEHFRRSFVGRGIQQELLKGVPTWLVTDTHVGILGAAQCAREMKTTV